MAALLTAGKWIATQAIPFAAKKGWGALTSVFGAKMTVGGALTLSQLPTAISYLDGIIDHKLSSFMAQTPFSEALQSYLEYTEWGNEQKANVISHHLEKHLTDQGMISPDDPDYARSQRLISAVSHLTVLDSFGAATKAADMDVNPSDLLESMHEARAENPDATKAEILEATFANLQTKVREQSISPVEERLNSATSQASSIDTLSATDLQSAFSVAADHAGFEGFMMKGITYLSGIFGTTVQNTVTKWAFSNLDESAQRAGLTSLFNRVADGATPEQSPANNFMTPNSRPSPDSLAP